MKKTRFALFQSIVALILCVSMLTGTTFAWFNDSVSSTNNLIASGILDVELEYLVDGKWVPVTKETEVLDKNALWEPGYTEVAYLKVRNEGNLALKYAFGVGILKEIGSINSAGQKFFLSDYIKFGVIESDTQPNFSTREDARKALTSSNLIVNGYSSENELPLYPKNNADNLPNERYVTLVVYIPEEVGNAANYATGATIPEIELGIQLMATQAEYESDSFGTDYDKDAKRDDFYFPVERIEISSSAGVDAGSDNKVANAVILEKDQARAVIPEGVLLYQDTNLLTLEVRSMDATGSNVTLEATEVIRSLDVHVIGVSKDNTVPMEITIKEAAAKGLNSTSIKLYHVEDGETKEMTAVDTFTAHNQFKYDPTTGDITLYMATFSEVALVADTENAWEGEFDYSWYTNVNARTTDADYTIANADQLAAFGAIVGGMNGQTQDSFSGKTVKLIADVNLGDKENANGKLIFHPIGYYYNGESSAPSSTVKSFEGTFDGNGHTIANFYQNTWEIKGDYDGNYYKDAMGLFGYVVNGTIKNLTVSHFSSDGEYTPTGVIAAYAAGNSTFENIAITNCNPRVYNTGNGGIIGIAGSTSAANDDHITLKNITVDNSNKISALWGSYDVACGGLVGMYRGNVDGSGNATDDTISFENCHVSAQIDVYNDVCANYQYYAYRYAGMIIGSVRHNTTNDDGKTIPNMTGISAENCTVNYGDWNDYYYCEFVKNSIASYTHDYQFSRVDKSEIKFDEYGNIIGCTHDHASQGTEIINGTEVLKEDKTAVYLPFHQLFTGYSWGVSSIGLKEYSGIVTDLGITEGYQRESVVKFTGKVNELANKQTIKLGDIFAYIEKCGVKVVDSAVSVTVTNLDENGNVIATFNRGEKWDEGTISFENTGNISITIQDYYFCTPTTITVNVIERKEAEKFESKFTGNFLYRVGNQNTVSLGSLFDVVKNEDGTPKYTINNSGVDVTIAKDDENSNVSGTFTANTTDWTKGTIKFEGTGVVKVTITDKDYCTPTELYLEVVDATNIPENGTISNYGVSSVLLGNTSVSTLYLNGGATLYGNGFTIDCTDSPVSGTGNVSENYIIGLAGAHLDNVKVVGKVYTEYGAMASSNYNRALVISTGNSSISNCTLSNTAAPVRINSGMLTIKDSTLKGGNFANIDIRSGHLTLDKVTTINQAEGNDKADDGSTVIGLGIVVYYEMVNTSATSITVKNGLTQYNNISTKDEFSNDYAKQFVKGMFDSSNSALQYSDGTYNWVNTGIILMTNGIAVTGAGAKHTVNFMSKEGAVYTSVPNDTGISEKPNENASSNQGVIPPSVKLDHDNAEKDNYVPKEADKNDYCYYDGTMVLISMDQGDTFQYDPFILKATKLGKTLDYTVEFNGNTVAKDDKISFNAAGDYTITYTYEDPYNYKLDENGALNAYTERYTITDSVRVAIVEPEAEHASFTFATNSTATEEILYNNNTYISAKGVNADGTTWGKITVGDKTIVYPIVTANVNRTTSNSECQVFYYVFNKVISIIDANGTVYDKTTGTNGKMPSNLKVVKGNELKVENNVFTSYNDANLSRTGGKIFCYSSSSQEDSPEAFNGYLAYKSPSGLSYKSSRNYDAAVIVQYQFTDSNNATYYYYVGYKINNPKNGPSGDGTDTTSCVTPDTLITLADGKQVRVDSLTGNEQLLVWNLETGKYDTAPIVFVDNDAEDTYEIIHLYFSDGSDVKVISEHGFFDLDLGEYVYIDAENYADYIGHRFVTEGNIESNNWNIVTLDDVVIETEVTTAWSPVTFEHLCYYTNGVLSMPGGIEGLFNIFEVDTDLMRYDEAKMQKDIETYGLFTIEDFGGLITEDAFNAFNGAYLKVAIAKGNLTWEDIAYMAERYIPLM